MLIGFLFANDNSCAIANAAYFSSRAIYIFFAGICIDREYKILHNYENHETKLFSHDKLDLT